MEEIRRYKPVDQQQIPFTLDEIKLAINSGIDSNKVLNNIKELPNIDSVINESVASDIPTLMEYYRNLIINGGPLDILPIDDILDTLQESRINQSSFTRSTFQNGGSSSSSSPFGGAGAGASVVSFPGLVGARPRPALYDAEFNIATMNEQMGQFIDIVIDDEDNRYGQRDIQLPVPIIKYNPKDGLGDFFIEQHSNVGILLKNTIAFSALGDEFNGTRSGGGRVSQFGGANSNSNNNGATYPARPHGELGIRPAEQCNVIIGMGTHSICWLCGYLTDMFMSVDEIQRTYPGAKGAAYEFFYKNDRTNDDILFDTRFLDQNRGAYEARARIPINPRVAYGFMDVTKNNNKGDPVGSPARPIVPDPPITPDSITGVFREKGTRFKPGVLEAILSAVVGTGIKRDAVKQLKIPGITQAQIKVLKRIVSAMTAEEKIKNMSDFMLLLTKQVCEHVLPVLVAAIMFLLYNSHIHKANCYRTDDLVSMMFEYLDAHHLCNCLKNDELWVRFVSNARNYHGTTVDNDKVNAFLDSLWDHERFVDTTDTKCASTVFCRLKDPRTGAEIPGPAGLLKFKNTVQYETFLKVEGSAAALKEAWKGVQFPSIVRRLQALIAQIKTRDTVPGKPDGAGIVPTDIGKLCLFSKNYFDTLRSIIQVRSPNLRDYWAQYAGSIPDPAVSYTISRSLYWAGATTASPVDLFQARLLLFSLIKQAYTDEASKEVAFIRSFDESYIESIPDDAESGAVKAALYEQLARVTTFRKGLPQKPFVPKAGSASAVNNRALHPYTYSGAAAASAAAKVTPAQAESEAVAKLPAAKAASAARPIKFAKIVAKTTPALPAAVVREKATLLAIKASVDGQRVHRRLHIASGGSRNPCKHLKSLKQYKQSKKYKKSKSKRTTRKN